MHVMFSPGGCVWVRHLAGQLDKQSGPLICSDVMRAQPKTFSSSVFMLAGAVSSMTCFSTLLSLAQSINIITVCSFVFLKNVRGLDTMGAALFDLTDPSVTTRQEL